MKSVAIIGAGLSGLSAARILQSKASVSIFEKSRSVSGRLSTRRVEIPSPHSQTVTFDHGAQYFTIENEPFYSFVTKECVPNNIVSSWQNATIKVVSENEELSTTQHHKERFVGIPGNNSMSKYLQTELKQVQFHFDTKISKLEPTGQHQWKLVSEKGDVVGQYDFVIISAPSPQTIDLLQTISSNKSISSSLLQPLTSQVKFHPCWATMIALESSMLNNDDAVDGLFVNSHRNVFSWIAKNSSKPNRNSKIETWVLHSSTEYAETHLEKNAQEIAQDMVNEFVKLLQNIFPNSKQNIEQRKVLYCQAHRWRFSIPKPYIQEPFLFADGIGICGDYCGGPKVEGAFNSGAAVGNCIASKL